MIYKYLGEAIHPRTNAMAPRVSCLHDGLFRITQPALLNDKVSEFRAAVFFNEFAPADYDWARSQMRRFDPFLKSAPSDDELAGLFLKPMGQRYGEVMPHLWEGQDFRSMEEFDRAQVEEIAGRINQTVVAVFSSLFGVLSLCEDPLSTLMWTHYGSEGRGIVVGFDERHPFFTSAGLRPVSYVLAPM